MSRIIRSAMLQMRVSPGVKSASEQVFWRIGLNMTEAMELFLRRVIVDQKLPFEVVALDEATMARIGYDDAKLLVRIQKTRTASSQTSNRDAHRRLRPKEG